MLARTMFVVSAMLLAFLYGLATVQFQIFPYEIFRQAKNGMEAFFGLVYPPSRISPETALELDGDQGYQQLLQQQGESRPEAGDDEIPF